MPDADLTDDGFLGGRLRILQPRVGYRAATDPVLLAAAVPAKPGQRALNWAAGQVWPACAFCPACRGFR